MADKRPIGIFDSGLGGLTAAKEILALLPNEDVVYLGDTARMPYGVNTRDTLIRYTEDDIAFLMGRDVKMILAACGTVSSNYPEQLAAMLPVPYTGVITPAVNAALAATKTGRIGLIATTATVRSGAFNKAFTAAAPGVNLVCNACPTLVTLIEDGHISSDDLIITEVTKEYLQPIKAADVDVLVLACTHFPIISAVIQEIMGDGVTLIDSGKEAAKLVGKTLEEKGLATDNPAAGNARFYVSAKPENFETLARLFLGTDKALQVEKITLGE